MGIVKMPLLAQIYCFTASTLRLLLKKDLTVPSSIYSALCPTCSSSRCRYCARFFVAGVSPLQEVHQKLIIPTKYSDYIMASLGILTAAKAARVAFPPRVETAGLPSSRSSSRVINRRVWTFLPANRALTISVEKMIDLSLAFKIQPLQLTIFQRHS